MPTIKAPMPDIPLPIDPILPELKSALRERRSAVLVAPPGAGKTTRVPIALADDDWVRGRKILVLEPRRIAARAAASRMASNIGQALGERVGLRVRFGSAISARTQIEFVTEGVFTRAILADPMLDGVAAILFDEFHERSLDADLGLALALDVQSGLRDDLKILVMSATLDDARIATLLGKAPIIRSEGRAYPVKTHYLGRDARAPLERQVADAALRALRAEQGSMLIFLPGAGEIRRTERLLREAVAEPNVDITPLYGALDAIEQDRAIAPALAGRRKIVLATSIAETSITIEGVRIVIDCGLSRVPRYDVDAGLTRLETVRVSRAAADQRRGRAGRTEPGLCYRLWDEPQTAGLEAYSRPEILSADLSSLALNLAEWGVADPATLCFLDSPPKAAFEQARALLRELGALDAEHRITERGRELSRLPLPPRLARMVSDAASRGAAWKAAELALLVTERGLGGNNVDLTHRLDAFRNDRSRRADDARRMARRWADMIAPPDEAGDEAAPGLLLARAFPDRIAKNRGNGAFTFANGRGANIELASPLARAPFLVVADVTGSAAQARIISAAPIDLSEIEQLFANEIETRIETAFDVDTRSLRARRVRRFKAILLADHPASVPGDEAAARALAEGIRKVGLERLPWSKPLKQWRERVIFLHRIDPTTWPDLATEALHAEIDHWLAPALIAKTALSQISAEEFSTSLRALLPWSLRQRLEADAPSHFKAPSGSEIPIDYESEDGPKLSVRLQEMFGLDEHPTVAGGRVRILIELTSPAQRPIQLTRDLPGFWRGSYAAVRSDMRGRYPKHPWPDDPLTAPATRRAKPRGT